MAGFGVGMGAFAQGFAGGYGLGQKFEAVNQKRQDREAIDKIKTDGRAQFDADVAAGKASEDQWNTFFTGKILPQMQQEFAQRGDLTSAKEAGELAEAENTRQGRSFFRQALMSAQSGDMDGALGAFGKLATVPGYGPAGYTYIGTRKLADDKGQSAGWAVDYRDGSGKSYAATFKTPEDFMMGVASVYAPEVRLKEMIDVRRSARERDNALGLYKDKTAHDLLVETQKRQAGLTGKPVVTEVYDETTGQPRAAIVNPATGAVTPIGGVKVPPKKPVPATIQNAEAEDLYGVQSITSINDTLDRFSKQIDTGSLQLGPLSNFISGAKNAAGLSSAESRNYASFQATLEKLRNDTLRLNKGVQTEGDAVRAWDELIKNINDPKVVKQRIAEITRLNKVAAEYRRNVIQQRRADNGLEPLDVDRMVVPLPPDDAASAQGGVKTGASGGAKAGQREGATATNPQTGEKVQFRNGQWVPYGR
ncbi:hypothetical protein [Xanthobacter sp. KR7-225]|uniref:hypothetical protein n=1 Tax=Xanthobacter sp. KR7-225 TaxID=3156613 RepID=UPI0032B5A560